MIETCHHIRNIVQYFIERERMRVTCAVWQCHPASRKIRNVHMELPLVCEKWSCAAEDLVISQAALMCNLGQHSCAISGSTHVLTWHMNAAGEKGCK